MPSDAPTDPRPDASAPRALVPAPRPVVRTPGPFDELRSEAFLNSPEPTIVTRARDGWVIDANRAFEAMSGHPRAGLVGHTTVELDLFQYPGGRDAVIAELFADGHVAPRPCSIRRADGTRRPGVLSLCRFRVGDEDCLLVTLYQVTQEEMADDALARSEERYHRLFEGASDAIFIMLDDCFVDCNRRALEMFRAGRDAIVGHSPFELSPPTQPDGRASDASAREHIQTSVDVGHHQFDWIHRRCDGADFPAEVSLGPIDLPSGRHLLAIVRDVTERHEAEAERRRLQDQLLQSQKMESVGRLAGGVAHDFNNMLTPILGHAELLRNETLPDDPRRARLQEIVSAAERCRDLVQRLLAFARRQTVTLRRLDLSEVVRGFERMLRHTLREDVRVVLVLADRLPPIAADRGQLEQVIMNLAVNAQEAMPDGGMLTLATLAEPPAHADDPGHVRLEVCDTGVGMDEATRLRACEPFFTTREHGTGLGLSIVFGIVDQLGGTLEVASAPGAGTTFRLRFPCGAPSVMDDERSEVADALATAQGVVLVVEDEPQVRALAVEVLGRAGFRVLEAADAEQALATARAHPEGIELLLTDVVLPDRNGPALYAALTSERPGLRVLYMSGYADDVLGHRGVLDDGIEILQKPFAVRALVTRVAEVLAQR
jgi:two-component system, cell cycle sensor histidine kinase and response regulator CckA